MIKYNPSTRSFSQNPNYKFSLEPQSANREWGMLLGTLVQATSIIHFFHLVEAKNEIHVALNDLYDELPDKVDELVEHYLSDVDNVNLQVAEMPLGSPEEYLNALADYVKNFEGADTESAICSQIDDIINLIKSTLYKIKRLS